MANNEFGDFQTPELLARRCLETLSIGSKARFLEPTCGTGTFLKVASQLPNVDSERIGLEINPFYAEEAKQWGDIFVENIFTSSLDKDVSWKSEDPLYVIGNPPWVTSAELRRMDSGNLPPKENFKKSKGLDALLGSSNFDVCEYIILKILKELSGQRFTLGMLCKTQVARNILQVAKSLGLSLSGSEIYPIDSKKWFKASVDACWFIVAVDPAFASNYSASVFSDLFDEELSPVKHIGFVNDLFVSDIEEYDASAVLDGTSPFVWRSGLKHDASAVFELKASPEPISRSGISPNIEDGYIFPLLKSTDIYRSRLELRNWVVVPQKVFGAETRQLEHIAPNLWNYLVAHAEALDGRKSSIYRNRPRFSVFGHGDYTYAPYKVAISGLHKSVNFQLVKPINGFPVVLDDTCYFLPFINGTEAAVVTAMLCSEEVLGLIDSLVFWDSKRPITKKLLSRIDISKLPSDKDLIMRSAREIAEKSDIPFEDSHAKNFIKHLTMEEKALDNALF